jgi:hypothetical protein
MSLEPLVESYCLSCRRRRRMMPSRTDSSSILERDRLVAPEAGRRPMCRTERFRLVRLLRRRGHNSPCRQMSLGSICSLSLTPHIAYESGDWNVASKADDLRCVPEACAETESIRRYQCLVVSLVHPRVVRDNSRPSSMPPSCPTRRRPLPRLAYARPNRTVLPNHRALY